MATENIETEIVPSKKQRGYQTDQGSKPSGYAPSAAINPFSYGKDGGKAAFANPPEVVVGGSSEVGSLPNLPGGDFGIGDDKNVSTPVSGL
jgi:hypothetical protein